MFKKETKETTYKKLCKLRIAQGGNAAKSSSPKL